MRTYLTEAIKDYKIKLNEEQLSQLERYFELLCEWNEKINLTAITDPEGIVIKHFLDCALLLSKVDLKENAKVIDVGTGAGFPGMVLKIARPDIDLTLMDSLNKRLTFLNAVLEALGLQAKTVHLRAEEGGKNHAYREKYDIACARAVAALPVLCEYCIPFVKTGGQFVAMKGASAKEELAAAEHAYKILGCEKPTIICENLRENEARAFIIAKKTSQTPPKYPRMSAKIAKSTL